MRFPYALVAAYLVYAGLQTPVFRSNVVIARLDVEAFDAHGKPVTDLTENDFTIFENGVRQDIRTFSREQLKPETPSPEATPVLVRGLPVDPVAPRTRRVFLIVLGYGRLQGPVKAFDGAARFIRERLLPQDLVAVMAFDRATDLTTDHEQAAELVDRLKARHEHLVFETDEYFLDPAHRGEDLSPAIQADIDAVFQAPGAPGRRARSATALLLGTDVFRHGDNVPWQRPWNGMVERMDLLKIYAGIEYLRFIEGEKHLICLTTGEHALGMSISGAPKGLRDSAQDYAQLAARANDARVVLDVIHTYGVPLLSGGAATGRALGGSPLGALFYVSASEDLAELTGGQYTGVSYADAALGRIDEATRFGYVLGYTPSNPALDDKYRKVTVQVTRPGVRTLFRHGYTAQADPAPLDLRQMLTTARLKTAEASDFDEHDIKVQAKASVVSAGAAGTIRVDLTIDPSRLSLTRSGDRRVGTIDVDIFCADAKRKVVGSLKQKMDLSLDEEHYQRALKDGIPYTAMVPTTGAAAHVRVFVYDYGADLLGTANVTIR